MPQTSREKMLTESEHLGTSSRSSKACRRLAVPIMLQFVAMLGIAALLYPSAANWFSVRAQSSEIAGYVDRVQVMPSAQRLQELAAAQAYNATLPAGVLRDPYSAAGASEADTESAAYADYEDTLAFSDNGVLGELSYPGLGIDLPIYHGTSDDVLGRGAGHLFGSSLPIGGASTRSVLTSHSGLANASLFTPLHDAQVGDVFQIYVLGETHYYQVQSTEVIAPDETDKLTIVNGKDLVTLITCTPIGINSHRLLINGVRIDGPDDTGQQALAGSRGPGFPWWVLIFIGVSAATAWLLFAPPRRRHTTESTSTGANISSGEESV